MDGRVKRVHSAETRAKMSASHIGKTHAPESILKMKSRRLTEEHRRKISEARKGYVPSSETRAKMSIIHSGKTISTEARERMSIARKIHIEQCQGSCGAGACGAWTNTSLEKILLTLLDDFPTVITQKHFGLYRVDAFLPEYGIAFEADGHRWHRDKPGQSEYDRKRDEEILIRFGVVVVRLSEDDLRR